MKRQLFCFILALLVLSGSALAAVCGSRIDSDGDRCRECALGNFGADALRFFTGADLALFASGDLGITLPAGEITEQRLAESFPYDKAIVLMDVRREELAALLEESLSRITLGADERIDTAASAYDGFFCVSGFGFSWDASAPVGQRLYDLPLEDRTYTLALPAEYAPDTADLRSAGTIREAVSAYCESLGEVTAPAADRTTVLGAWENQLVGGYIPRGFVLIVAVVAMIFGGARYRRRLNTER